MSLPETISVKYTEEEAQYLSVRAVVKQTFRVHELVDMILGVTGKDRTRIQKILRTGAVVYNFYRYQWQGFEAGEEELQGVLDRFPDAEPGRKFCTNECRAIVFESGGQGARHALELTREEAGKRKLLRGKSFWERVMELSQGQEVRYQGYSYGRRADLFAADVGEPLASALQREAGRLARRSVRAQLAALPLTQRIVFVCPRLEQTGAEHVSRAGVERESTI